MSLALPHVFGSYVLHERLGAGASATVYLAIRDGRVYALKLLHVARTKIEQEVARFRHEAEIAQNVNSPYVARVFETGRTDDTLYIAMEYIAGCRLSKFLSSVRHARQRVSVADAVAMFRTALIGMDALHTCRHPTTNDALQIVHRDISPKNLLVAADGMLRVIDLGLGASLIKSWETRTGLTLGTPGYIAPETVVEGHADQRSDLFSLGVVLHETLTLQRLIKTAPVPDMLRALVELEADAPSVHNRHVPPELDAIVLRALDRDPERRFESAKAFDDAITAAGFTGTPRHEHVERVADHMSGDVTVAARVMDETPIMDLDRNATLTIITSSLSPPDSGPTTNRLADIATLPTPADTAIRPAPAGRRFSTLQAVVVCAVVCLAFGSWFGFQLGRREPASPALNPTPTTATAIPRVQPAPAPSAAASVTEDVRPTPTPTPRFTTPEKIRRRRFKPRPSPSPNVEQVEPSLRDRVKTLARRARAVRRKVDDGDTATIDALINDIELESIAERIDRRGSALDRLEARLVRLERAPARSVVP